MKFLYLCIYVQAFHSVTLTYLCSFNSYSYPRRYICTTKYIQMIGDRYIDSTDTLLSTSISQNISPSNLIYKLPFLFFTYISKSIYVLPEVLAITSYSSLHHIFQYDFTPWLFYTMYCTGSEQVIHRNWELFSRGSQEKQVYLIFPGPSFFLSCLMPQNHDQKFWWRC